MSTEPTPLLTASVAFGWVSGIMFLVPGIVIGFWCALMFHGGLDTSLGIFDLAYVVSGIGLFEGILHHSPIYDGMAMGIQMTVFTYLREWKNPQGRNVLQMWPEKMSSTR